MAQKKQVLILCTGNSCRSIMAEALINAKLQDCVIAQSSGIKAVGYINKNVKKLLIDKGYWRDSYFSKTINKVLDINFDLIITVCDNAKESCPMFPKKIKTLHVGFVDPSGNAYYEYEKTLALIENKLLPIVKQELCSS